MFARVDFQRLSTLIDIAGGEAHSDVDIGSSQ